MERKSITKHCILFSPFVLAFLWIGYLLAQPQPAFRGEFLSPGGNGLIQSLGIFLLGYALFLMAVYSDAIKRRSLEWRDTPKNVQKRR
ncbi:MAG TPA: hypothetical protein VJB08_02505 [Candidatus Nanoarchaeia archaeon]|nr:hypothetical protein [Candidatus Nanoarchaeia archaeon]